MAIKVDYHVGHFGIYYNWRIELNNGIVVSHPHFGYKSETEAREAAKRILENIKNGIINKEGTSNEH